VFEHASQLPHPLSSKKTIVSILAPMHSMLWHGAEHG
jgi:hypothetical protein